MKIPKKLLGVVLATGVVLGPTGCVNKKVVYEGGATCIEITKKNLLSNITTLKFCNAKNYKSQSAYYIDSYLDRIPDRMYAQDGGDYGKLDGIVDYLSINTEKKRINTYKKKRL